MLLCTTQSHKKVDKLLSVEKSTGGPSCSLNVRRARSILQEALSRATDFGIGLLSEEDKEENTVISASMQDRSGGVSQAQTKIGPRRVWRESAALDVRPCSIRKGTEATYLDIFTDQTRKITDITSCKAACT